MHNRVYYNYLVYQIVKNCNAVSTYISSMEYANDAMHYCNLIPALPSIPSITQNQLCLKKPHQM